MRSLQPDKQKTLLSFKVDERIVLRKKVDNYCPWLTRM